LSLLKAQPLKISIRSKRISSLLKKLDRNFAWLLPCRLTRGIQVQGYPVTLAFAFLRKCLKPTGKIAADHNFSLICNDAVKLAGRFVRPLN